MKLFADKVREMIEVDDDVVVAYGYTLDRKTLLIYFHEWRLVRETIHHRRGGEDVSEIEESEFFEPEFFFRNVKRWYLGEPGRGLNENLAALFETFGRPLSTTPGGRYP